MRIFFPPRYCLFTLSLMIVQNNTTVPAWSSWRRRRTYVAFVSVVTVYFSCDLFQYLFLIIDGQRGKKGMEWKRDNGTSIRISYERSNPTNNPDRPTATTSLTTPYTNKHPIGGEDVCMCKRKMNKIIIGFLLLEIISAPPDDLSHHNRYDDDRRPSSSEQLLVQLSRSSFSQSTSRVRSYIVNSST